ncbi:MAG: hypothetical protein EOO44_20895 [Flavobacterium sp.]|nr:MAG: hypothetical protein EOO44_20895 [Flavobacterium sp.]
MKKVEEIVNIKFKESHIIISITLCILGLAFAIWIIIHSYLPVKIIAFAWIMIIAFILLERMLQFLKSRKGIPAIKLNEKGIMNNSVLKATFIPWNEIKEFQTSLYRTQTIFINVNDTTKYKTIKGKRLGSMIGYVNDLISLKPYLLWIDIEILDIKKDELMASLKKHKN